MISRESIQKRIKEKTDERAVFETHLLELRRQELEKQGLKFIEPSEDLQKDFHGDCDHPSTMENGPAIILYLIVMIGGSIFIDRLIIWVIATIIFYKFITRHKK